MELGFGCGLLGKGRFEEFGAVLSEFLWVWKFGTVTMWMEGFRCWWSWVDCVRWRGWYRMLMMIMAERERGVWDSSDRRLNRRSEMDGQL